MFCPSCGKKSRKKAPFVFIAVLSFNRPQKVKIQSGNIEILNIDILHATSRTEVLPHSFTLGKMFGRKNKVSFCPNFNRGLIWVGNPLLRYAHLRSYGKDMIVWNLLWT